MGNSKREKIRGKKEFPFMRKSGQVIKATETLKAFCETES